MGRAGGGRAGQEGRAGQGASRAGGGRARRVFEETAFQTQATTFLMGARVPHRACHWSTAVKSGVGCSAGAAGRSSRSPICEGAIPIRRLPEHPEAAVVRLLGKRRPSAVRPPADRLLPERDATSSRARRARPNASCVTGRGEPVRAPAAAPPSTQESPRKPAGSRRERGAAARRPGPGPLRGCPSARKPRSPRGPSPGRPGSATGRRRRRRKDRVTSLSRSAILHRPLFGPRSLARTMATHAGMTPGWGRDGL